MKQKSLLTSLLLILALGTYTVVNTSYTNSSTLGGYTSACSCHGSANTATTVTISGLPTFYNLNTAYPITVTVSNASQLAAGFQLQANIGTITSSDPNVLVYTNSRSAGHQPKKNMTAGSASFSMTWTSPSVAGTAAVFDAVGNAVNLAGGNSGDMWNTATSSNVALPVNFSDITAKSQKKSILIQFTTNNEKNVEAIEIERGVNGQDFKTITRMPAKGNSTYTYSDYNFEQGQLNYYRVKEISEGGAHLYSSIVSAKINTSGEVLIYPTLITNQEVNIEGVDLSKKNQLSVFTLTGHKVFTAQLETSKVRLPNISSGNYILSINGSTNTIRQISIR